MARSLRLLADMNISPLTVQALVEAGWEAHRVSTPLPEDSSDEDILAYAAETDRVVCTQDLDFSDLLAVSGRDWPSVITLRLSDAAPEVVTDRLLDVLPLLAEDLERGAIVTVDDDTVRVRSLPIGE